MPDVGVYEMVDTWNDQALVPPVSTTYKAIAMDVTDTSSADGSLLLDLLIGGVSKFSVNKAGNTTIAGTLAVTGAITATGGVTGNAATATALATARTINGVSFDGTANIAIDAVTSVGQSFTGGLISVAGSPITSSGTLALTVAGNSGGIPYFDSGSSWASSAALTQNALMIGGGAGGAPSTTTTGTGVLTALGVNTGSAGAFVVNGGALGTPTSGIVTNLTGTADININGTVGATTPAAGAFTTLAASSTLAVTSRATIDGMTVGLGGATAVATNMAVGVECLASASLTGAGNVGMGYRAGKALTSGFSNICIGNTAGSQITTGARNVAIGNVALSANHPASFDNICIGHAAGMAATSGVGNVLIGTSAGGNQTGLGNGNLCIGGSAGFVVRGNNNIYLGFSAGSAMNGATASSNLIIGVGITTADSALASSATDSNQINIANCYYHDRLSFGASGTTRTADAFLVRDAADILALRRTTNPQGLRLYNAFTSGTDNEHASLAWSGNIFAIQPVRGSVGGSVREIRVAGGLGVGTNQTGGGVTIAGGQGTGTGAGGAIVFSTSAAGGSGSSANALTTRLTIPAVAGRIIVGDMTVGRGGQTNVSSNTAIGFEALDSASLTAINSTAVGYQALKSSTSGGGNVAVGKQALTNNTTGSVNVAIGNEALLSNTTGDRNAAVGGGALFSNTTGSANMAFGHGALARNVSGGHNCAIGSSALNSNTTGGNSTVVGTNSVEFSITHSENVGLGYHAGRFVSGANNTFLGSRTGLGISRGVSTLGTIAAGSGYTNGTYSNVSLTRSSGSTFGDFPTATIEVAGGAVTTVTLVSAGKGFQSTDTVLTAASSAIGGTGTGFTVAVASLTGAVSSDNTLIGYRAGDNLTQGSRNIIIGSDIDAESTTASDQINIGDRYFHNRIRLLERNSDPAKPAEGNMVVWLSDGTGLGDDGDVMIGSTAGGVTNYAILFDHSAGTLWP